jgi:hypothetical protein
MLRGLFKRPAPQPDNRAEVADYIAKGHAFIKESTGRSVNLFNALQTDDDLMATTVAIAHDMSPGMFATLVLFGNREKGTLLEIVEHSLKLRGE